ncbi:GspE/PulE family protein [Thermoactinomyces sp. CICC 10523]|uniref:GspE/PulE family protein n=1 Tax=Thermoactinomyces sp. CICC 10523 TaxID=2767428 RepID=UPI0018DE03F0|nr:GspE/PulE family protein [Thermoactinomyces sp. CICC 10523]MBH8597448.1 type II/IV secretion system protein [Thermoactinomyces sp. CICC 10523]
MNVVDYIDDLFLKAQELRASDIHLEPMQHGLRVRLRVDGFLQEHDLLPAEHAAAITARVKLLSHLDISEKRIPQDGKIARGQLDLRVSTLPTLYGEKIVLRLFKTRGQPRKLENLGMEAEERAKVERLLKKASGLIIVTGPTGSGKTTTLYAMLEQLNRAETNIVTLEDPIELQLPGINQVQILPKSGLTFARGLRAVLRQDPNVIMIGEIRDLETAAIAISAALTGHLVLTSLHTDDTASAVMRLIDMGIEPFRVAAALAGVVAQRLVRLPCAHCRGSKCADCGNTGYYGRTGVFEVMESGEDLGRLIVGRASLRELRAFLIDSGMKRISDAVMDKVRKDETTIEEWMRVIDGADEMPVEN